MTIPEDAIEAAAAVILPYVDDDHFNLRGLAGATLEAAALHMGGAGSGSVWLEGYMAGREDERKSQNRAASGDFLRFDEVAPNPYEEQK